MPKSIAYSMARSMTRSMAPSMAPSTTRSMAPSMMGTNVESMAQDSLNSLAVVAPVGVPAEKIRVQRPMMPYEARSFKMLQSLAYEYDNYNLPLFQQIAAASPEATRLAQLECFPIIGNLIVCCIIVRFIGHAAQFACLSGSTKAKMWGVAGGMLVLGFIPFFNVWLVDRVKPLYQCWRMFSRDVGSKGLYTGVLDVAVRNTLIEAASSRAAPSSYSRMTKVSSVHSMGSDRTLSTATLNGPAPLGDKQGKLEIVEHTPARTRPAKASRMFNDDDDDDSMERSGFSSFLPVSTARNTMAGSDYDSRSTKKHSFESARASTMPEEADFLKSKYSLRQSAIDNWPLKR
ncbi:hypothetical protein H4R18_003839 [Coemansia javaensis]|uniref:Uncharacterized protein n=1 Tax=Coemansia javaensis TaxID=2761396 RepID=A0A9W8HAS7_9FUNG|nr:hypothetical protein H4R18_003839 [Coemansia javaensis]